MRNLTTLAEEDHVIYADKYKWKSVPFRGIDATYNTLHSFSTKIPFLRRIQVLGGNISGSSGIEPSQGRRICCV